MTRGARTAGKWRLHQAGFAMLLAISITTMMLAVAMMCLNLGLDQKLMGSGVSTSQRSLLMAEAGAKWAEGVLPGLIYPYGAAGAFDLNGILALPTLDPNDTMCSPAEDCTRYHLLTVNGPVPFGDGTYRVGVTCYPDACTVSPPTSFETRTEGSANNGPPAILEVGYTF